MQIDERDGLVELIGTIQMQAEMLRGLLEVLVERGFITEIEETELFSAAEKSLSRAPKTNARVFASKMLSHWRDEGLVLWPSSDSKRKVC